MGGKLNWYFHFFYAIVTGNIIDVYYTRKLEYIVRKKYNRLLCYILGVVFLLLGIDQGNIRAFSSSCRLELFGVTAYHVPETENEPEESCTLQMLTKKKISAQTELSSQSNRKRVLQESSLLLLTLMLTYYFIKMREIERALRLPERCREGMISHFIHHQDGKKRCLFV